VLHIRFAYEVEAGLFEEFHILADLEEVGEPHSLVVGVLHILVDLVVREHHILMEALVDQVVGVLHIRFAYGVEVGLFEEFHILVGLVEVVLVGLADLEVLHTLVE
jgi:hypothetical protein